MKLVLVLAGILVFLAGNQGTKICQCNWLFHRGHCYYFSDKTAMSFGQAEDWCRARKGYLVKVNNRAESDWLRKIAKEIASKTRVVRRYWLGASDAYHERSWKWTIDYTSMGYKRWSPRQPDNAGGRQHCLVLWRQHNYSWDDDYCQTKRQHICESSGFNKPACTCNA